MRLTSFFFAFSCFLLGCQAQEIEDIHYTITDKGHIRLFYKVNGMTQYEELQLRIAYSYVPARGGRQWFTLKREDLPIAEGGEVYFAGSVELASLQNFLETAEIRFELLAPDRIIGYKYFTSLLDGAYERQADVFVPIEAEQLRNTPENPRLNLNEIRAGTARMRGGNGIRGLTERRILHRCEELAHLTFEREGVAWFYLTVTEAGKVSSAIYTVRTTTGEESTIDDNMEMRNFARACIKCFRFATAYGKGLEYGFVPVYFTDKK